MEGEEDRTRTNLRRQGDRVWIEGVQSFDNTDASLSHLNRAELTRAGLVSSERSKVWMVTTGQGIPTSATGV